MGKCKIPADYTWKIKISSYDVGQDRKLRLSSQLKLQQEVGELHFEEGGLGFEELVRNGMSFVITRTRSKIYRAPHLNEQVTLSTWHRNSKGAQFFRCYQFFDSLGNPLIESVSAFALVDPQTHKILRPTVFSQYAVTEQPKHLNNCPDPARINLPENLNESGLREVRWSDIDYNGHLNNAVYADIITDTIPVPMREHEITEFSIAFINEALEGEKIALKTALNSEQLWVTGEHQRGRCFEANVKFAP
jgi:medium-chain acyl-[acyl-carrier-protein] hydrolase